MKYILAFASAALCLAASPALAASLTSPSVTLSNYGTSQSTSITASGVTTTALSAGDLALRFSLPSDFTTSLSESDSSCSGLTLYVNGIAQAAHSFDPCLKSKWLTVFMRASSPIAPGSTVEIRLASGYYTTPPTTGAKTFAIFHTAMNGSGTTIDDANPKPTVTIVSAPPASPVPTLSEWALMGLATALAGLAAMRLQRPRRQA